MPDTLDPGPDVLEPGEHAFDGVALSADLPDDDESALDLSECRWTGARLTGVHLRRFTCTDVIFEDCDLSGVVAEDSSLSRVEFHRCRMSGIVLAGSAARDVLASDSRLDGANLRMLAGSRLELPGCDLRGADLFGATLTTSRIHDGDLTGADFSQSIVGGLRLHGSIVRDILGVDQLRGAVVSRDQQLDLAMALFDASGITVEDER